MDKGSQYPVLVFRQGIGVSPEMEINDMQLAWFFLLLFPCYFGLWGLSPCTMLKSCNLLFFELTCFLEDNLVKCFGPVYDVFLGEAGKCSLAGAIVCLAAICLCSSQSLSRALWQPLDTPKSWLKLVVGQSATEIVIEMTQYQTSLLYTSIQYYSHVR